jgi:uncharacterized membrane protein YgaE (UPF0421/DUF939 family)
MLCRLSLWRRRGRPVHTAKNHALKQKYKHLVKRQRKGRAIVAIARRMLELIRVLSKSNTLYRETTTNEPQLKLVRLKVA